MLDGRQQIWEPESPSTAVAAPPFTSPRLASRHTLLHPLVCVCVCGRKTKAEAASFLLHRCCSLVFISPYQTHGEVRVVSLSPRPCGR